MTAQQRDQSVFQQPTPEYPDADQIRAYGALNFLFMRAPKYNRIAYEDMRLMIQPPIDLRFYKIIEIEGVPRAAITWAFMSPQAEAKLITKDPIVPSDWASGTQAWIMEPLAPYSEGNFGAKLVKAFLNGLKPMHTTARYPRFQHQGGPLKHITEYRRRADGSWGSHRLSPQAFADDLKKKGGL